jgi:thioredoxin-related protein
MQSAAGSTLAPIYNFQYTPTFIFFDAQGKEVWRSVGQLDVNQLRDTLK